MNKIKRNDDFFNVFNHLKERKSMLLNLFDMKSKEIFELGCQAPSPSKDYCQLVMTREMVIFFYKIKFYFKYTWLLFNFVIR